MVRRGACGGIPYSRRFCRQVALCVLALAVEPLLAAQATTRPLAVSQPFITVQEAVEEAREWVGRPARERDLNAFTPAARIVYREYMDVKPLRVWIARIDMSHPNVRPVVTQPADETERRPGFETRSSTTLEFARQTGVQLAINSSSFGPMRERGGEPMDVIGLAAVDGRTYSTPRDPYGAMYIGRDKRVSLRGPPLKADDIWIVVPGFRMLLDDGVLVVDEHELNTPFGGMNPRTAVGTDRDGRTLWIVIVDGRQPGISHGMTLVELACLFKSLGAWDALNLDGGGSTTFVLQTRSGEPCVVNTPVGQRFPGTLRQVGNNLGLFLPGVGPESANLSATSVPDGRP
ncbi:MAG: phosphodiester glycosidase family protein [Phycisphaerae bacterium]|jgi:hypothetical protein